MIVLPACCWTFWSFRRLIVPALQQRIIPPPKDGPATDGAAGLVRAAGCPCRQPVSLPRSTGSRLSDAPIPRAGGAGRAAGDAGQAVRRAADGHLPALDGLRGAAVLLMMLYHFAGSISTFGLTAID